MKQLANINSQVKIHDVAYPKHTDALPWELSSDSQFSINAEEAWRVSKGSSEVTVAIIDDGFDTSRLPENARFELLHVRNRSTISRKTITHGSHLAELIIGNREGYPGVAPECNLLMIDLPSVCTETEEALAFDIALNKNAAVVCCAWGEPSCQLSPSIPKKVANSIDELVKNSRNGLGAVVLFAVGNNNSNVRNDVYASYPSVTTVAGITKDGQCPYLMDYGDNVDFVAPVSSSSGKIGGHKQLPPGASGAVALSSGVVALVVSANQSITANHVVTILKNTSVSVPKTKKNDQDVYSSISTFYSVRLKQTFGSGVLNAAEAVTCALQTTTISTNFLKASKDLPSQKRQNEFRLRERRFIGGEHALLGHFGSRALQKLFHNAGKNANDAFFGGMFSDYYPDDVTPFFDGRVNAVPGLLKEFFAATPGVSGSGISDPGFDMARFPNGKLPYGYLLALAGDIYGSPPGLRIDIASNRESIRSFCQIFSDEIHSNFEEHSNIALTLIADVVSVSDHSHYLSLAKKNYSHFAGDNLLAYMAHHLQAVMAASNCTTSNSDWARYWFTRALISEAFAGHFLTDMFSAGHARVPRYAFLHEILKDKEGDAHLLSGLLHDHDGRKGLFMKNDLGHLWYAYGDAMLLDHSAVVNADHPSIFWNNSDERLGLDGLLPGVVSTEKMHPKYLAGSLVFASLADVIRNMATGMAPNMSNGLSNAEISVELSKTKLLKYILKRLPFALPVGSLTPNNSNEINAQFNGNDPEKFEAVANTTMEVRLHDYESLFETYDDVSFFVKFNTGGYMLDSSAFKTNTWSALLQTTHLDTWKSVQTTHLKKYLTIGTDYLSGVTNLITSRNPQSTLVEPYFPDANILPASWKVAIPQSLNQALIDNNNGVWG